MITETENMVIIFLQHFKDLHKFKKTTLENELNKIQVELVKWNTLGAKEDLEYHKLKTRELEIIDIIETDLLLFKNYVNELQRLK
jgi:hypothetical protein